MGSIISYTKTKLDQLLALKADVADAVDLSDTTPPIDLVGGYAGTADTASRGDHQHVMVMGTPYAVWGGYVQPFGQSDGTTSHSDLKCPMAPFPVPRRMTLSNLATRTIQAGDTGNGKFALYASANNGFPTGAPIWTSSAFDVTSSGKKEVTGISQLLEPGLYWLAFGHYGLTSTRCLLRLAMGRATGYGYFPMFPPGPGGEDTNGALYALNFNESTGAFPTLTAQSSDFSTSPAGAGSHFYYAIVASAA